MPRRRLSGKAWADLRKVVLARDDYRCRIGSDRCTGDATEVDHIEPVMNGGSDDLDNLRASCQICNRSRRHPENYVWAGIPVTGR